MYFSGFITEIMFSFSHIWGFFLPDRHEVEDIRHSGTVTQQITKAELENYGRNQNTVPAHKLRQQGNTLLKSI